MTECRGVEIRGLHPIGFRSGEWAKLLKVERHERSGHYCYFVRFADGHEDQWVVGDPDNNFEMRAEARTSIHPLAFFPTVKAIPCQFCVGKNMAGVKTTQHAAICIECIERIV